MGEAAADAPVAVWVDYRAPQGCPDHALLMSRIAERNVHLDESSEAPPAQRYRLVVSSTKDGYAGRLEQPETRAVREVSGTDCTRVVDALALVIALSATGEIAETVEAVEADEADEAEKKAEAEKKEGAKEAVRPAAVTPARVDTSASGAPADTGIHRKGHAAWLVAAGGAVLTGLGPRPFAGPVVGFDWAHDDGWLSLRGSARWAFGFSGSAGASSWQAVPELCLWVPAGPLELSGCGGGAMGRVVSAETEGGSAWVAPLVTLGLRVPLGGANFGELRGELDFPLARTESAGFDTPKRSFGLSLLVGFGGGPTGGMKTASAGHEGT
ncbi:MAG TPA: hypothetical protein VF103_00145 [Polyangiaceae bacterium]